jgi:hypothetical protein
MKFKDGFLFGCGVLLVAFIILFIVGNSFATSGSSTGVNLSEYTGTINTNGNGYVYVQPDIAKITVGVITESSSSTQAMADNANQMDQVVKAVKKAGIADKDIQTSRVSVEPEYASEVRDSMSSYKIFRRSGIGMPLSVDTCPYFPALRPCLPVSTMPNPASAMPGSIPSILIFILK